MQEWSCINSVWDGEALLAIMSSLAQKESRSISENCTWGQRKHFADGKVTVPLKRFLGYNRSEDGSLEVNREQAEVVKRIYEIFLKGMAPHGIAKTLMEERISTPADGNKWGATTIGIEKQAIICEETGQGDPLVLTLFSIKVKNGHFCAVLNSRVQKVSTDRSYQSMDTRNEKNGSVIQQCSFEGKYLIRIRNSSSVRLDIIFVTRRTISPEYHEEVSTMNERQACDLCGVLCEPVSLTEFSNQQLCPTCLENETRVCDHCFERIWADDDYGDASRSLCQNCYDRYYARCDCCGRVVPFDEINYPDDDDDRPLCYECFTGEVQKAKPIHDYYFKPEPIFHGSGPRFFGVELEIDEGGELTSNAEEILDAGNAGGCENIYIKHDGSLSEGLEIVTHPASLDYHMDKLPWPDILETARRLDYRSHQCGSCGLHCYVSRNAFGLSEQNQDACIARVLYFVEKHWEELLKFSRRTPRQLERWAARYGYKDQPIEILDHAKKGYHAGRYTCVNLENSATIEFRLFRGTLKLNTLLATLQMVDRICDVALFLSDEEIKAMSWTTFVSGCTRPELVQYLKERRLYINEPVSVEEEV